MPNDAMLAPAYYFFSDIYKNITQIPNNNIVSGAGQVCQLAIDHFLARPQEEKIAIVFPVVLSVATLLLGVWLVKKLSPTKKTTIVQKATKKSDLPLGKVEENRNVLREEANALKKQDSSIKPATKKTATTSSDPSTASIAKVSDLVNQWSGGNNTKTAQTPSIKSSPGQPTEKKEEKPKPTVKTTTPLLAHNPPAAKPATAKTPTTEPRKTAEISNLAKPTNTPQISTPAFVAITPAKAVATLTKPVSPTIASTPHQNTPIAVSSPLLVTELGVNIPNTGVKAEKELTPTQQARISEETADIQNLRFSITLVEEQPDNASQTTAAQKSNKTLARTISKLAIQTDATSSSSIKTEVMPLLPPAPSGILPDQDRQLLEAALVLVATINPLLKEITGKDKASEFPQHISTAIPDAIKVFKKAIPHGLEKEGNALLAQALKRMSEACPAYSYQQPSTPNLERKETPSEGVIHSSSPSSKGKEKKSKKN